MLDSLVEIARSAGTEIMCFYRREGHVTSKKDASPLTEADRAAHVYISDALQRLRPGLPVVSEEREDPLPDSFWNQDGFWLVDPLDGTKEFLKQTGEFTVNIALIEKKKVILGVVHAPALGLTYFAERDRGAWRQLGNGSKTPIRVRKADKNNLWMVVSKDHVGPKVSALMNQIPGAQFTSMGSSLKFCLVAEGKADLYLRDLPTMEWDTAAAQCIVEAAGGAVHKLSGRPLRYQKPEFRNKAILTFGDTSLDWVRFLKLES